MTSAVRPLAVVCGTGFGRVYLSALDRPDSPYRLAGVLARGSDRSFACAEHYGVPLYRDADEVPNDIALACVVVGSGLTGGPGVELAQQFLERGIPVLQEHPLHPDELASCLRLARKNSTVHHVDTLFVHIAPIRRFVMAARQILTQQNAVFIEATCAYQVLQTLFEVLAEVLGGAHTTELTTSPAEYGPFRTVSGRLAGVPFALRVQHELDPRAPDNHAHLLHRITIGVEGGQLTLVNTHGPVVWSPRAHMPADIATAVRLSDSTAEHLDLPSARAIGPIEAPSYRHILKELWPEGILHAITELRDDVAGGDRGKAHGQRQLQLSRLVRSVNELLGPVSLVHKPDPEILEVNDVLTWSEPTTGAS